MFGRAPKLTISAPSFRSTTSRDTWIHYLEGDLKEVLELVPQWVRGTAIEQVENQIAIGNTRQYTAIVDRSRTKAITQAERNVRVFFVSQVFARNLAKAKSIIEAAVRKLTTTQTGVLAGKWQWYLQRGGPQGSLQYIGPSIPSGLTLRPGDAMILAPEAGYAFFANYYASRKQAYVPREVARARKAAAAGLKPPRRRRPPRGFGFIAYAARRVRPEFQRIGVSVWPRYTTELSTVGHRAHVGIPMLVFVVSKRGPKIFTATGENLTG